MPVHIPASQNHFDCVLLDMVNDDALWADAFCHFFKNVENQFRAFQLVFEMRRVNKNQLVVFRCKLNLHFPKRAIRFLEFLFKPISPMPRTFVRSRNFGIKAMTSSASFTSLGFLGIDAQPAKMFDAEFRRAFRFVFGPIAKNNQQILRLRCGRIPPKNAGSQIASHPAIAHAFVIVRRAADHVGGEVRCSAYFSSHRFSQMKHR